MCFFNQLSRQISTAIHSFQYPFNQKTLNFISSTECLVTSTYIVNVEMRKDINGVYYYFHHVI